MPGASAGHFANKDKCSLSAGHPSPGRHVDAPASVVDANASDTSGRCRGGRVVARILVTIAIAIAIGWIAVAVAIIIRIAIGSVAVSEAVTDC
jgi:hypothetical protein